MEELPQYWVSDRAEARAPDGRSVWLSAWGWSRVSMTQAAEVAAERLRLTVDRFGRGTKAPRDEYYPRTALREPVLHQIHDGDVLAAEVSRNRYGAEVLNTDAVLIADVDFPERSAAPPVDQRRSLLGKLFGRPAPEASAPDTSEAERAALERVAAFAGQNDHFGTHVYRTFAGLRVIVTGSNALPTSPEAAEIMAALDTDPVYVTLCATHATYRARLTPKPWRVGRSALRLNWPYDNVHVEKAAQRWVADYEAKSAGHATCSHIASFGAEPSAIESRVLELHDQRTLARVELPLA
ncbi:MAG: hypothetical protein WA991_06810 [Ornithinimicrobium sp.]